MKKIAQKILEFSSRKAVRKNKYKVIAITGSVGKTSTKKAVSLVVSSKFKVLTTQDEGYNTEFGIPLVLLERNNPKNKLEWILFILMSPILASKKRNFDFCILEYGADKPGDISALVSMIPPDIAICTNVSESHLKEFKSIEDIKNEKEKIFSRLNIGQYGILNSDNDYVKNMRVPKEAKKITFGKTADDVKILEQKVTREGTINKFLVSGKELEVVSKSVGEHLLNIFGAAVAVGISQGISLENIRESLTDFKPVKGRMTLIEGLEGSIIIDDSYNANPASVKNALDTLSKINGRRKIAALGDMNELGDFEKEAHEEIGRYLAGKCDILVTVGKLSKQYLVSAAIKAGMDTKEIYSFENSTEAGDFLKKNVKKGDVVLLKGSQNKIRMEKAVKIIVAHPEEAKNLLCRQGKEWKNK